MSLRLVSSFLFLSFDLSIEVLARHQLADAQLILVDFVVATLTRRATALGCTHQASTAEARSEKTGTTQAFHSYALEHNRRLTVLRH